MKSTIINSNSAKDAIVPAIVIPGLTRNPDALLDWIPAFAGMTTLGFVILRANHFSIARMMRRVGMTISLPAPGANHA